MSIHLNHNPQILIHNCPGSGEPPVTPPLVIELEMVAKVCANVEPDNKTCLAGTPVLQPDSEFKRRGAKSGSKSRTILCLTCRLAEVAKEKKRVAKNEADLVLEEEKEEPFDVGMWELSPQSRGRWLTRLRKDGMKNGPKKNPQKRID